MSISLDRARELLATGQWVTEAQLEAEIAASVGRVIDRVVRHQRQTPGEYRSVTRCLIDTGVSLDDAVRHVPQVLVKEYVDLPDDLGDLGPAEFRSGPGVVWKVGATAKDTIASLVTLGVAITSFPHSPIASATEGFAATFELVRKLFKLREKIEDPDELLVFETLYRMSNRFDVANYVAYEQEDWDRAFDYLPPPTLDEIVKELEGQLDAKSVHQALLRLEARDIVGRTDEDRWRIRF